MQEALFRGLRTYPQDMHPTLKKRSLIRRYIDRVYGNRFYGKGMNMVNVLSRRYDAALEKVDVLVMPTMSDSAPEIPPADCPPLEVMKNGPDLSNTMPFNLTGHPALSINVGFSPPDTDRDGLPIGLMIVGKKFDEVTVLQVARALEKLTAQQQ